MHKGTETIFDKIIANQLERANEARRRVPFNSLVHLAESRTDFRDFASAISSHGVRVIAEMKKASPSAGLLRAEYRCRDLALGYEAAGAAALSILTEKDYFQGSLDDLREARSSTRLPVLRKDFIVDEYQVYESAAVGADALLLIVAAIEDKTLRAMIELSHCLGIAALVEVHTEDELDRALNAGAQILGVNNRNLKTLEVNLHTSFRLRSQIPADCLSVAESGIRSPRDLRDLMDAGFNAALVGEYFMRQADPGRALTQWLAGVQ